MKNNSQQPRNKGYKIRKPLTSDYRDVVPQLLVSTDLSYMWSLCKSTVTMNTFRAKCRMHFQNEGRDYSIQKYGNKLVLMCKVCKRKVLVSFETKTPSMRMEVFGRDHADEIRCTKHYTYTAEVCKAAATETPLNKLEKECYVANMLHVKDTYHSRCVIKETLLDIDVSSYVLALSNCNPGVKYDIDATNAGVTRVTVTLPAMAAIKYSPKLIGIDGTFHHTNKCTMVFATIITQENNIILGGISIGMTESTSVIMPLIRMIKEVAAENGVDPAKLKFISDRGSAIIKSLQGCTVYNCTFHIAQNVVKHVKRETGVTVPSDATSAINTQLAIIAKSADITEVTFRIMEIVRIFQQYVSDECAKRYRNMEDAALYVEYEVIKYLMEKANKEHWMTLAMSSDPCRFGHTTSSFAESYNNSINYARRSCLGNAIASIVN